MGIVKLKKLLSREENRKALDETVKALGIEIAVEDFSGIVYGKEESLKQKDKYEIALEGEIVGWVLGETKASCIAAIVVAMCKSEKEKKALADETLEKYREINILYNVSEKIATTGSVNAVSRVVVTEASKHIEGSFASIILLEEGTDKLETVCQLSTGSKKVELGDNEILNKVIHNKTGEIANNVQTIEGLKALICAPISVKNKVMGVMIIGNETPIEYTASDLKLCNALAFQAGASISGTRLYESLRENFFDTVQILSQIIEMKDSYKNGHYKRVMNYCLNIGRAMGMSKMELVKLKLAVMLHDIGNLSIGDELLNKKGKFSEEEYEAVKSHAEIGADMLKKIDQLKEIIPIIRSHHECYDGTGYPDNLAAEDIPICSRIIAVADAFDAMTNNRPHKAALSLYFAADELMKNKGIQFDPVVVDTFFRIYKDMKLEEIQEYIYEESKA